MQHRTYWTLAFAGIVFVLSGASAPVRAAELFNNTNTLQVNNCPQPVVNCSPAFTLGSTATIDDIQTYHRQGGPPASKSLSLRASNGSVVGPFQVTARPASPGFENWVATVGQTVPADTYTVLDSQADTWQQNTMSGNKGFAIVRGTLQTAGPPGGTTGSITDCTATCAVPPAGPLYACSAHGPNSRCAKAPPSADFPGGGVTCTDGKNVTTCNCQNGCTTR